MDTDHCPTCSCGKGAVIGWQPVVAVLLLISGWDAIGLLLGEQVYARPSHDALRELSAGTAGTSVTVGVRVYGITLLIITAVAAWSLLAHRYRAARASRWLRLGLSGLAAYWVSCCFGAIMTIVRHGQVDAWGAVATLAGIAAIAVLVARTAPPTTQPTTTGKVHRAVGAVPVDPAPGRARRPHPAVGN